jgi:hypothetical protein
MLAKTSAGIVAQQLHGLLTMQIHAMLDCVFDLLWQTIINHITQSNLSV